MPRAESIDRATRTRLREHLRAAMAEHRLTAAKLARRIGISPSTISTILSGGREVGFDVFIKLHKGLGVSANYMLDEDPTPQAVQPPQLLPSPSTPPSRQTAAWARTAKAGR